jgi:hypothetical protein
VHPKGDRLGLSCATALGRVPADPVLCQREEKFSR